MEMSSVYPCDSHARLPRLEADLQQLTKMQQLTKGMPPQKFWNLEHSESGSEAILRS